jgi:tungstate transport system ATP-binding protein
MNAMRDAVSILPLTVTNLAFESRGKRLLDNISFELTRSDPVAVLGPNGAGKSLLLRLCHGLISPSAGRIGWAIGGGARRHAMVFQTPVMLRRSAIANVRHAIAVAGISGRHAAQQALDRFGLGSVADRPARLLSGGEQQRLAIARAWALRPEVLFLDEPTSQLDPGATRQIEDMLAMLAAEGVTLVMTTHDLGQARRLGRRVLFLNRGRLVEDAPAAQFFSAPASAEARAFLAGELLW